MAHLTFGSSTENDSSTWIYAIIGITLVIVVSLMWKATRTQDTRGSSGQNISAPLESSPSY